MSLIDYESYYILPQFPITVILALTVPIVDYDEEDHKWNKWLNCLHCLTAPLTMVLLIQVESGPGENRREGLMA